MRFEFCRKTKALLAGIVALALANCSDSTSDGTVDAVDAGLDVDGSAPDVHADDVDSADVDNAEVEVEDSTCALCHGSGSQAAPPPGVGKNPMSPGVGAHAAHLANSTWHAKVQCAHCHVVPKHVDDEGHIDGELPADVHFSGLATSGFEAKRRANGSCAVYCHGSAMRIDPVDSLPWSGTGLSCGGGCHQLPPAGPHPNDKDCSRCHIETMNDAGEIIQPSMHIDAVLQAPKGAHLVHLGGAGGPSLPCSSCHDGTNYHGPLRDGKPLGTTTVCNSCHDMTAMDRETWYDDMIGQ